MKKLIGFMATLLVCGSSFSQGIRLGEFKGRGPMDIKLTSGLTGDVSEYKADCSVALNIEQSATQLAIPFSLYDCKQLSPWNDAGLVIDIRGNELYLDGKIVGSKKANLFSFTIQTEKTESFKTPIYDRNCNAVQFKLNQIKLQTSVNYKMTQKDELHYHLDQSRMNQSMQAVYVKPVPSCPSFKSYVVQSEAKDLSVDLRK